MYKRQVLGCLVGLSGLYLLSLETGKDLSLRLSAVALIGAALLWSIGTLFIRKGQGRIKRNSAISIQLVYGGLFQFLLAFLHGEDFFPGAMAFEMKPLLAWSYLVIFGSVLAMNAYNYLIKTTTPAIIGTYALANQVVALFLGFLLFDEALSMSTVIAGILVLAGVALILIAGRKKLV